MYIYYLTQGTVHDYKRSRWGAFDGPFVKSCWMVPGTFDCDGNSTLTYDPDNLDNTLENLTPQQRRHLKLAGLLTVTGVVVAFLSGLMIVYGLYYQ